MTTVEFLIELFRQGVELRAEGDRLHYRAPTGVLTSERLARIAREKADVLALLTHEAGPIELLCPLSFGQRALWFLYRVAPDSAAYNIPLAVRIRSPLDVAALRRAFQTLVDRHPSLRTSFSESHGQPVQRVHAHQDIDLAETDAASWTDAALAARVYEASQRPFDLTRGPVLRVSLFTRSAVERILLLTVHHIVIDYLSLGVLVDELGTLYEAEASGTPVSLPAPAARYADFVHWQADTLAGPEGEKHWSYWRDNLRGRLPTLNLPTDRPRPPVQTYRGASFTFRLEEPLVRRLKGLARAGGATLYAALVAGFQVLLRRYTGQDDMLVASITSGRSRPEYHRTVGYFANPVVLRLDTSGNPSFRELLGRVRDTVHASLDHQDFPFPLLVERLQPTRDASRAPLVNVMVDFLALPGGASAGSVSPGRQRFGALDVEPFEVSQQEGQFDLSLFFAEADGAVSIAARYHTDLFDESTVARLAGHYRTLLGGVVDNPTRPVLDLPLLADAEREQLVTWNDVPGDYPNDRCLHHLFEEQVARTPEAVAVVSGEDRITYAELNRRANRLAFALRRRGVGPEVTVGICLKRSVDMVAALFGVLKAGGAYVPFDSAYPKGRLAAMREDAGIAVLVTETDLADLVPPEATTRLLVDGDGEAIAGEPDENLPGGAHPDNLAYVIYTSGSTGRPKGVAIEHHSAVALVSWARRVVRPEYFARVLAATSISFDVSVFEIFATLGCGGAIVLAPNLLEAPLVPAADEITMVMAVPSPMAELVRTGRVPRSVRAVWLAGECLPNRLAQDLYGHPSVEEVVNVYGPSEDTTYSTLAVVPRGATEPPLIGRPLPGTQAYVLDDRSRPVPVGVYGELCIGGAGLARGYLGRPDLTAEKFIPDPFGRRPGGRLYRTGDLARFRPDGNLELLGRADHQVKVRGFRVELGEIEAALAEHPRVRDAIVVFRENGSGEKRLAAYLVQGGGPIPVTELRRFLKERLPDYMVPSWFVFLESFPLTPNGKVDRAALPPPDGGRPQLEVAYAEPEAGPEQRVAAIWREVLNLGAVGRDDNFFDIGGHSLLLARVQDRLEAELRREVPIVELFRYPTVRSLASYLQQGGGESTSDADRTRRAEERLDSMRRRRALRRPR